MGKKRNKLWDILEVNQHQDMAGGDPGNSNDSSCLHCEYDCKDSQKWEGSPTLEDFLLENYTCEYKDSDAELHQYHNKGRLPPNTRAACHALHLAAGIQRQFRGNGSSKGDCVGVLNATIYAGLVFNLVLHGAGESGGPGKKWGKGCKTGGTRPGVGDPPKFMPPCDLQELMERKPHQPGHTPPSPPLLSKNLPPLRTSMQNICKGLNYGAMKHPNKTNCVCTAEWDFEFDAERGRKPSKDRDLPLPSSWRDMRDVTYPASYINWSWSFKFKIGCYEMSTGSGHSGSGSGGEKCEEGEICDMKVSSHRSRPSATIIKLRWKGCKQYGKCPSEAV